MIEGLIVAHRDLGDCLIRVVESITGTAEALSAISNEGLSTRELSEKIKEEVNKQPGKGILIFVDAYGGSCWQASKLAKTPQTPLITGVNLSMLLSFIHKRKSFPLEELAEILTNDGRRGIIKE
jgi:mannose/fructose-specific phosphotransferase system component IIA